MNSLLTFFTPAWLADTSFQVALWLLLAGLVSLWPGWSAARRHFAQAASLLLVPLLLAAGFIVPGWRLMSVRPDAAMTLQSQQNVPVPESQKNVPFAMPISLKSWVEPEPTPWVGMIWLVGIAGGLALLGGSAMALRRMRHDSDILKDRRIRTAFDEEAAALGLRLNESSLRMSAGCGVPMTWGLFSQKTVLLPREVVDWPETRLRLVLRHELAHLVRGDVIVSTVMSLVAVLLWFHPAVWLMLLAAQRSREQACDDLALGCGDQNASDFAHELLAAVEALVPNKRRPLLPLALAMSVSGGARLMRGRLQNILRGPEQRGGFGFWQKAGTSCPPA